MATGRKIIAEIGKVDGKEPIIRISDSDFEVAKSKDGAIYIVYRKSEKYWAIE